MLLAKKCALITGAGGNLGSAIAEKFAAEGCRLWLGDIRLEKVEHLAADLRSRGYDATALALDVTDEQQIRGVFAELRQLDILVNNAGRTMSSSMVQSSLAHWEETLRLNLSSAFLCSKHAFELLGQSDAPSVINMSSINAFRMNPWLPAYAVAKSGMIALTKQTVLEGARYRIRANSISPGLTMSKSKQDARRNTPDGQADVDCYPLGRLVYPEDVANAALFLASPLSSFVNGTNLVVDGGMSVLAASSLLRPSLRSRWKDEAEDGLDDEAGWPLS